MSITVPNVSSALANCVVRTEVPGIGEPYRGKVRDVYPLGSDLLGIVVTDRISAFDHIMRQAIPYKGQILNRLAEYSFAAVGDLVSTHLVDVPHPNVTIAKKCDPIPIEVVVRAYVTGHAWRVYRSGERILCGVRMEEGLREHDRFVKPILTPATKATEGHDEDISEAEILRRGIVGSGLWEQIRETAFALFERGSQVASECGLLLVDTKYEFGLHQGVLTLIDEVHTADSSRYFYADGYKERQSTGEPQKQLSKEFLREWLIERNFQGLEGQILPDLPDDFRWTVFERYRELFEQLTGQVFTPKSTERFSEELPGILGRWV